MTFLTESKISYKRVLKSRKASGRLKKAPRRRVGGKKRPTSTRLADTLFSKYIRERDGKCVRCGGTEHLQCSHFWPRAISSVRYDPENCDALCYGCHYGDRYHGWEYAKQGEYRDFKMKQLGDKAYADLALRATITVKRNNAIKIWLDQLQEIRATGQSSGTANTAE